MVRYEKDLISLVISSISMDLHRCMILENLVCQIEENLIEARHYKSTLLKSYISTTIVALFRFVSKSPDTSCLYPLALLLYCIWRRYRQLQFRSPQPERHRETRDGSHEALQIYQGARTKNTWYLFLFRSSGSRAK